VEGKIQDGLAAIGEFGSLKCLGFIRFDEAF